MSNLPAGDRPRVSAAVLRHDGQEALMVQHRRRDGTTYWQLPGGGVEAGETPEAAVLRELREETGIEGRIVQFLFAIPYKYGQSMTFLVEVVPQGRPSSDTTPKKPRPRIANSSPWPGGPS